MDIKLNNMKDWKDVLYDSMEDKTDNFKTDIMTLKQILKDKRIESYDIECFGGDVVDTYLFYIENGYISTWDNGGTICDEKPFGYISDLLKAKDGIIKVK